MPSICSWDFKEFRSSAENPAAQHLMSQRLIDTVRQLFINNVFNLLNDVLVISPPLHRSGNLVRILCTSRIG